MSSPFIDDGFTLIATIKGRGCVPDLEVTYRPALARRIYQWKHDAARCKDAPAEFANDAKLICEQVNSWSGGRPVTPESVEHLLQWQVNDLLNLVAGYVVPDAATGQSKQQAFEGNS